ncbi:UDP-N-acetylglucosamine--N-acetylmuramyl-(pentapeptide) pyrophosphoryl-undecaprenol N-acetylglucosamine transferase [Patulibacter americanus]|uniref:UDP-N-acetylglucosamine--N-acetylmuramyl- (pentapeptide) pyrophosphoryl-undecaprenol N-acetylglucosamine transferase n=1 Tax=Patulibacter americanus TaxID=588672 RepID=UPI0004259765|nr:UDP-N-acetylglucosamine--N-acetylmuramyl-(pentapeptide) pyrophosphoryl-undecaprenol N-acetylglucosamine transferase [Patulibacter americanus]
MVPALAVADELRDGGHRVVFVGGDREEARLVPEAGYELHQIRVEGFSRTHPLKAARAGGRAVGAVTAARRILGRVAPDAVMGGGGYVAGVVGAAAVSRRIPLVLTEADSHLGVSNRLLHRRAHRVCLGFPIAGRDEPTFRVTGRPVPEPFGDHAGARDRFGLDERTPTVLVFGGSLGARSVNEAAIEGLRDLTAPALDGSGEVPVAVIHASGRRDHAALRDRVPEDGPYRLFDYLSPLSPALAACDLVVSRSGGSIAEVTAHGRPAILVPYPHAAADHQTANARWMADAGAAVVIGDGELTAERLRTTVAELLGDRERLERMAGVSAGLARPQAARAIADEVLAAAGGPATAAA